MTARVFLFSLLLLGISFAQKQLESEDTSRFYLRKSISFYDGFFITQGVSIPKERYDYLVGELRKNVFNNERLVRFDRNPIPAKLMEKAKEEISKLQDPSIEKVREVLEKTFAPEILKVVNIEKELRAKDFVTQQERYFS